MAGAVGGGGGRSGRAETGGALTLLMIDAMVSVAASVTLKVAPALMMLNVSAAPRLPLLARVVVAEATLPKVSPVPPAKEPLVVMAP